MHRAQILLEPGQHRALQNLAKSQGRSISSVVREMINKQLQKYREEQDNLVSRQMAVIDCIRRHKTDLVHRRHGKTIETDVVRMIDENRDERDAAIFESG